ncbi:MAG: DUF1302 family protein [Alphaproteobacteria bacterium]|nr:DUF1302 family protein [Alphaproteobacteria bacterium]
MPKSHCMRLGMLGSVALIALTGAVTSAGATEIQFGDINMSLDTTVSMGMSMRTQSTDSHFLNESNGGPVDPRENGPIYGIGTAVYTTFGLSSATVHYSFNRDNFDGSINADDGKLNFDKGDLTGATLKATHDFSATWRNYKVFARATGFYDFILSDPNAGARSTYNDKAIGRIGRNYQLLDAFVSADYSFADMPLNIRVGKQVINWGESTFLLNGNNVFSPIDVAAFRRPGSEIKEALLPVAAIEGSISLPYGVSLAGYYALDWEPFKLDPAGSPFSSADVIRGTGFGGNDAGIAFVTGSPFSGNRRNCDAQSNAGMGGTAFVQTSGLVNDPLSGASAVGNNLLECSDLDGTYIAGKLNYAAPYDQFLAEQERVDKVLFLSGDGVTGATEGILSRGGSSNPDHNGDHGLKLSYYSEELGGTEFGAYYQNYSSRLPYAGLRSAANAQSTLGFFTNTNNINFPGASPIPGYANGLTGRQLNPLGCGLANPGDFGTIGVFDGNPANHTAGNDIFFATNFGFSPATIAYMKSQPVNDPGGVLTTAAASAALGSVVLYNDPTLGYANMFTMMQLNCVLSYYQSGFVSPDTGAALSASTTIQSGNGAEFLIPATDGTVYFDYPTGIDIWGGSFATTLFGWGVQGEFSYRPNAPFQVDTDSLTIASLVSSCLFDVLYGAAGPIVDGLATPDGSGVKPFCGNGQTATQNYLLNDMWTAQIGTTATFTNSEWFIDAIGADLGIFVTEVGTVYVPGVEDTWVDKIEAAGGDPTVVTQYQNIGCQGTDLPGGGILGLDVKSSSSCRPTDWSAGLVLLFRADYSNAFNSGFVVSPLVAFTWDFTGTTPAPYGNYMEDRKALNLGVSGTLNNNFTLGVNYVNYFGGHIQNRSRDLDYVSGSMSYSF